MEKLQKSFCVVLKKIRTAENIATSMKSAGEYMTIVNINNTNSFYLSPTDDTELVDIITKIKPQNSADYDNISSKLLNRKATKIAKPLVALFSKSLSEGIFPETLKQAKEFQYPKKRVKDCVSITCLFHY